MVKAELPIDGDEIRVENGIVKIAKRSPWRFIQIKPVLLNHERQSNYIEILLTNPQIEYPTDPATSNVK